MSSETPSKQSKTVQQTKRPQKSDSVDIDVYHRYYVEQRRKLGLEKYDDERSFIRSAFERMPNLRPEVDSDYLRGIMPAKKPVKTDVLDVLEERVVMMMVSRASADGTNCRFTIPALVPGLPLIKPEKVLPELVSRLSKRNIRVYPKETEEALVLDLHWGPDVDATVTR
jgi:hypothetical protein